MGEARIRVAAIRRALVATIIAVCAGGLIVEILHHRAEVSEQIVGLLSLSDEGNLPTWTSSLLLLACAAVLGLIASAAPDHRRRWALLGLLFGYLSIDESIGLHEELNSLVDLGGPFYFGWILPAAAIVVALGIAYLPFVRALPPPTRRRVVLAGCLYLGGALVMEIPLGLWTEAHGDGDLGYALIDFVEESLEMSGAAVFLVALLRHAAAHSPVLRIEDG